MGEHVPGSGGDTPEHSAGAPRSFGDVLRSKSAGWLLLSEEIAALEDSFDRIDALGFDAEAFRGMCSHIHQRALLMQSTIAAQARAYDDMIAAGGPEDREAYELYEQATEFHNALLAARGDTESGSSGSP